MTTDAQGKELRPGPFYAGIAVLAVVVVGIVVPHLWRDVVATNCNTTTAAEIPYIVDALEAYAADHGGRYPSSLDALVTTDDEGKAYLDWIPLDPWKNEYQYEPPTPDRSEPLVYSFGGDGARGGEGEDADISSSDFQRKK